MNSIASLEQLRETVKKADKVIEQVRFLDCMKTAIDQYDKVLENPKATIEDKAKAYKMMHFDFGECLDSIIHEDQGLRYRYLQVLRKWLADERKGKETDFKLL